MAKLNMVSEKTLRLYHKKGLLNPSRIDAETGYRYYTLKQCPTIDFIQQMKGLGLSLSEIGEILEIKDVDRIANVLKRHLSIIDDEISGLLVSHQVAQTFLNNCALYQGSLLFNEIGLELMPERRIIKLPAHNPALNDPVNYGRRYYDQWEITLRLAKYDMAKAGLPLTLFKNVGCVVPQESLIEHRYEFSHCFLFVSSAFGEHFSASHIVPRGYFVTMLVNGLVTRDGTVTELDGLARMMAYIEQHDYEVIGDYLGEVIAESPAFHYKGRDCMFRMQIPVRLSS
jgi:DNA-binding transcriptional MerR regulator